jgi:hypothetical protein
MFAMRHYASLSELQYSPFGSWMFQMIVNTAYVRASSDAQPSCNSVPRSCCIHHTEVSQSGYCLHHVGSNLRMMGPLLSAVGWGIVVNASTSQLA